MPVTPKIGTIGLATIKGHAPHPAIVCAQNIHLDKKPKGPGPHILVFFFGTKDYGWIKEGNFKSYVEFRDSMVKTITSKKLKDAVKRCDEYLSDKVKYKANVQLDEDTDALPPKKTSVKKKTKRPIGTNGLIGEAPSPPPKRHSPDTTTPIYTPRRHNAVKIGFIGAGKMGFPIVKRLLDLDNRREVYVWNRDPDKSRKLAEFGAEVVMTPCDVAEQADITFLCLSDASASGEIFYGNDGILSSTERFDGKGFVEMTGLDSDTSQYIAYNIKSKGGRYLEAPMQGSPIQAEKGTLVVLAAGERTLFDDCRLYFKAIAKHSCYLGGVGHASNMYAVCQLIDAFGMAVRAKMLALAEMAGMKKEHVLEVIKLKTQLAITEQGDATHQPLTHLQKDFQLALLLSEQFGLKIL